MFKNYLKMAWRSVLRDRQFSVLNLLGLSTGLACALLIWLWVNDECNVDQFNEKNDRLYQVMKNANNDDGTVDTHESTPGIMAKSMAEEFPEIEYAVSVVNRNSSGIVSSGEKLIKSVAYYAGNDFFNIFSYKVLEGTSSLKDPKQVLLSDHLASKLFGNIKNAIGKNIDWTSEDKELNGVYKVSGVYKSPPANATDQFDALFSYDHYYNIYRDKYGMNLWYSNNPSTYLVLKKGTDVRVFNKKISGYSQHKMLVVHGPENVKYEGKTFIQKYSDKYLHNHYVNGEIAGGRIAYVTLFSIIAFFIIFIACINFMNLATARASARMKEVGVRKVIGARRGALILQYMSESTFMAFLSLLLAVVFVWALLPQFRMITGKQLQLHFDLATAMAFITIALGTGLLAGSYPAIYLSAFKPAWVLKGSAAPSGGKTFLRKGLVVFQFTTSVVFIIAVIVVYRQMNLVQKKNLGFNRNNIIYFSVEGKLQDNFGTFLTDVKKIPGVVDASGMAGDLTGNHSGGGGIDWEGKSPNQGIEFDGLDVNYNWLETFGMKMKEGRPFSRTFGSDSAGVIFNETAIRAMGIKDPVGKKVRMWGKEKTIIGVVKDFHYESLYTRPGPFFIRFEPVNPTAVVKLKPGAERTSIAKISDVFHEYNKGLAFDYKFVDDDFEKLYASEQRVAVLSRYFAGLAVIISCLGLLGLSAFTAQKRQKEIGIRKVVGAAVHQIAFMLSVDFLKLVFIALLIGMPVAWWVMHAWLNDFEYRINMDADIFIVSAVSVLVITLATISIQAFKAAIANPVKSLRDE